MKGRNISLIPALALLCASHPASLAFNPAPRPVFPQRTAGGGCTTYHKHPARPQMPPSRHVLPRRALLAAPLLLLAHAPTGSRTWTSSASTNEGLVKNLHRDGRWRSPRVGEALLATDRALYVPPGRDPYQDAPQPIGFSATISAPHMHAYVLELLEGQLQPGAKVLDVGCGSGYLLAAFAQMVGEGGEVVGIEHIQELADKGSRNLDKGGVRRGLRERIQVRVGDGRKGAADAAPFDAIHVGAAAPVVPPPLVEQLRNGGRMIIPVGPEHGPQVLVQVDKRGDGSVGFKELHGVRYVPLTDAAEQRREL